MIIIVISYYSNGTTYVNPYAKIIREEAGVCSVTRRAIPASSGTPFIRRKFIKT